MAAAVPPATPRVATFVALVCAVGIALRLRQFAHARPLWLDELFLALNVTTRGFAELARPLAWDQNAPILFLWLERIALLLGGHSERVLRAPSFVAGCLTLPLVWLVGRRVAGRGAAALATALAAVSPYLIYFSNELKPYALDALVTLVLVLLALRLLEQPAARSRLALLAAAGALAPALSSPSIFTLAAVGAALAAEREVRRQALVPLAAMGASWAAAFVTIYTVFLRHTAHDEFLRVYFRGAFLNPREPDLGARLSNAVAQVTVPALHGTASAPAGAVLVAVIALLAVAGLVRTWRRRGVPVAALLVLPGFAAATAAALERYPVVARTMLFAAPLTLLAVAAGVEAIGGLVARARWGRAARAAMLWVAGGALVTPAVIASGRELASPLVRQDARAAIAHVRARAVPGDVIYLTRRARTAWAFYTTNWRAPDLASLDWLEDAGETRVDPRAWAAASYRSGVPDTNARRVGSQTLVVQHYPTNWVATSGAAALPFDDWAASELRRLLASAPRTVWMVSVTPGARAELVLLDTVRRSGALVTPVVRDPGVTLYRLDFRVPMVPAPPARAEPRG